jgi:hypothetical protein
MDEAEETDEVNEDGMSGRGTVEVKFEVEAKKVGDCFLPFLLFFLLFFFAFDCGLFVCV